MQSWVFTVVRWTGRRATHAEPDQVIYLRAWVDQPARGAGQEEFVTMLRRGGRRGERSAHRRVRVDGRIWERSFNELW
jgi:hypothetical protein